MFPRFRGSYVAVVLAVFGLVGAAAAQTSRPQSFDELMTEAALTRRMERLRPTIESFLGDALGISISVRPATYAELRARVEERFVVASKFAGDDETANWASISADAVERLTFQTASDSAGADQPVLIARRIVDLVREPAELEVLLDFLLASEAANIDVARRFGKASTPNGAGDKGRYFSGCIALGFAEWLASKVSEKTHGLVLTQRAKTLRSLAELLPEPASDEDIYAAAFERKQSNRSDGERFMSDLIDRLGIASALVTAFQRPPVHPAELLNVDTYLDPSGIVFDSDRIMREIDVAIGIGMNQSFECGDLRGGELASLGVVADSLFAGMISSADLSREDGESRAAIVVVGLASNKRRAEALTRDLFSLNLFRSSSAAPERGESWRSVPLDPRPGETISLQRGVLALDRHLRNGHPKKRRSANLVVANGQAVMMAYFFDDAADRPALIECCRTLARTLADPPTKKIAREVDDPTSRNESRPLRRFFGRLGYRDSAAAFPNGTAHFWTDDNPTHPMAVVLEKGEFSFTARAERAILGRVVVDGQTLRSGIGTIVPPETPFRRSIKLQKQLRLRLIDAATHEPIRNAVVVRMRRHGQLSTDDGDLGRDRIVCRPMRRTGFVETTDARGEIMIDSDEQPIDLEVGSPRHAWRRVVVLTAPVKELEVTLDRGPNLMIRLDGGRHDRDVSFSLDVPATSTKPGEAVERWFTAATFKAYSEDGTFDIGPFPNGRCRVTLRDAKDGRIVDRVESELIGDDPQTIELSTDGFRTRSGLEVVFRLSEKWRGTVDGGAFALSVAQDPNGPWRTVAIEWPEKSPIAFAQIPDASPGPLYLFWKRPEFEFGTEFQSRRRRIEFLLPDPALLTLDIVDDETGEPIENATICGRRPSAGSVDAESPIPLPTRRIPPSEGSSVNPAVEVAIPSGRYEVIVQRVGYSHATLALECKPGAVRTEHIRLKKSATLELEVTLAGKPYRRPIRLEIRDGSTFRELVPHEDTERPGVRKFELPVGQNLIRLRTVGEIRSSVNGDRPPVVFTIVVRGNETVRKTITLEP